ncbi:MAG TPA: phage integrase SAM-like domain-containing protein [Chryseolinea sp.]|nr:phage integrase SAM-like domain-containing protein [Chryseolinea sp.]
MTSQVEERRNTELNNYLDTFQMKVLEALAVVEEIILLSDLTHKFINDYAFFLKSVRNVEHNTAMGLRKTLS